MAIPNFFIVGAPKAGTTSLYHYLEEHPDVYMSPIKETNYFSYNEIKEQGLFYNEEYINTKEQYLAQFTGVKNEKAIGEASVSYLFYNGVAEKIKAFNPDAKIIIVLRNPVERGFSHYLMDRRLGFVNMSYQDILDKKKYDKTGKLYYQQYIELGLYYNQLQQYFSVFDKARVKVFLYEDLQKNIQALVKELYNFLEVDADFLPDLEKKHNAFIAPKNPVIEKLYKYKLIRSGAKLFLGSSMQQFMKNNLFSKEKKPVLDHHLQQQLLDIYKDDIERTAVLINRNINNWLV